MKCPRCGNKNVKKIGEFYQCQSGLDENYNYISGCGFIGKNTDFTHKTLLK